jgi:hypothetical protein
MSCGRASNRRRSRRALELCRIRMIRYRLYRFVFPSVLDLTGTYWKTKVRMDITGAAWFASWLRHEVRNFRCFPFS